jgi:hypothetical protein
MSEVIQSLGEALPVATAAIGFGVGYIGEQKALASQALNGRGFIRAHRNTEKTINSQRSFRERYLPYLAIVSALAGGAAGEALVTHDMQTMDTPALTEAVDHTFGTGITGDGSDKLISHIATGVAASKGMHVRIEVAHDSTAELLTPAQTNADHGYGSQTLPDATADAIQNAFSSSSSAQTNALGASKSRNAGILLVTDGDSAGNPKAVINYAEAQGNLPVFAVNVGPNSDQTAQDLRTITSATGGKYWHASKKASAATIAGTIKQEIVPKAVDHKSNTDRLPWEIFAVAATGLGIGMYRSRTRHWERKPQLQPKESN